MLLLRHQPSLHEGNHRQDDQHDHEEHDEPQLRCGAALLDHIHNLHQQQRQETAFALRPYDQTHCTPMHHQPHPTFFCVARSRLCVVSTSSSSSSSMFPWQQIQAAQRSTACQQAPGADNSGLPAQLPAQLQAASYTHACNASVSVRSSAASGNAGVAAGKSTPRHMHAVMHNVAHLRRQFFVYRQPHPPQPADRCLYVFQVLILLPAASRQGPTHQQTHNTASAQPCACMAAAAHALATAQASPYMCRHLGRTHMCSPAQPLHTASGAGKAAATTALSAPHSPQQQLLFAAFVLQEALVCFVHLALHRVGWRCCGGLDAVDHALDLPPRRRYPLAPAADLLGREPEALRLLCCPVDGSIQFVHLHHAQTACGKAQCVLSAGQARMCADLAWHGIHRTEQPCGNVCSVPAAIQQPCCWLECVLSGGLPGRPCVLTHLPLQGVTPVCDCRCNRFALWVCCCEPMEPGHARLQLVHLRSQSVLCVLSLSELRRMQQSQQAAMTAPPGPVSPAGLCKRGPGLAWLAGLSGAMGCYCSVLCCCLCLLSAALVPASKELQGV